MVGKKCKTENIVKEDRHLPVVELPVAPDGGWGWVVVFCSFMIHVIADGVTYTFGIFYVEFLKDFQETKAKTAWVASLMVGTTFCIGPIASGLTSKYGCRAVTIAGSLMAACGLAVSVTAKNVTTLFFTIGLCTGAGFGLMYLPAIVSVTMYFEKKRAFATGIAVCGSGFGTFALAPCIELLVHHYGWRGAMLCTAGMVLHCCVFGVLLRPLEETSFHRKRMYMAENAPSEINGNALSPHHEKQLSLPPYGGSAVFRFPASGKEKQPSLPPYNDSVDCAPPTYSLSPNGNVISMSTGKIPTFDVKEWNCEPQDGNEMMFLNGVCPQNNCESGKACQRPQSTHLVPMFCRSPSHEPDDLAVQMETKTFSCQHIPGAESPPSPTMILPSKSLLRLRKDIFYSGSVQNLSAQSNDMLNIKEAAATLPRDFRRMSNGTVTLPETPTKDQNACERCCWSGEIQEAVKEMMNFSLLMSPIFLLFAFSNFFTSIGYNIPYVYITDRASLLGISDTQASYLLSAIGVSNTVGRVILGYVSDRPWLNRVYLYNACIATCGIATSLSFLAKDYQQLVAYCLIFGVSSGAFVSLTSVILVDILGLDKLTNAFGLVLLFEGVASIIGPPFTGWLFDVTGSYDPGFFFSGGVITMGGLLLFLIPCFKPSEKENPLLMQTTTSNKTSTAVVLNTTSPTHQSANAVDVVDAV